MRLESVRAVKDELREAVIEPMVHSAAVRSAGLRAQPMSELTANPPTIALGVAPRARGDFRLAVRVQKRGLEQGPPLDTIRRRARGEIEVRYIGLPIKRAALPWHQKRSRPLKPGASIGHFRVTAGTLGAFARDRRDGTLLILSNSHVLANENRARKGDAILQPGAFDGGRNPEDRVGSLCRSIRLRRGQANLVDAAVAALDTGLRIQPRALTGLGRLAGLGGPDLLDVDEVAKLGRTTGATLGRVTAFELDGLQIQFDLGVLRFDGQIEIEGLGDVPFSQGGDSGSLIVDSDRRAVALLFAGSDLGGTNGLGLTYAHPIQRVLDALMIDLHIA